MKNGNGTKAAVTKRAREWRVNLIERWLIWAFDTSAEREKLSTDFDYLVRHTMKVGWSKSLPPKPGDGAAGALAQWETEQRTKELEILKWLQREAQAAIESYADGEEWSQQITALAAADQSLTLYAVKGKSGTTRTYHGNLKGIGLLAIQALVSNDEARRITRCAEPGCREIFVERKAGHHCAQHATSDARAHRFLAKLSPEQKTIRRRKHYLSWLKQHRPAQYQHLKKAARAAGVELIQFRTRRPPRTAAVPA